MVKKSMTNGDMVMVETCGYGGCSSLSRYIYLSLPGYG